MTSNTEIVKLNIGGTLFHTTKSTLTKFNGFFKNILETDVPVTKDKTGAFFIDRDPTHFRLILNFIRDGDVKLPACEDKVEEISKEAQYYLLTGLMELCSKHSQIEPNNELFEIFESEDEESLAVLNSKKPVLVVHWRDSIINYVNSRGCNEWKQFVKKHSPKWNIFLSRYKSFWCIHYNGTKFPQCCVDYGSRTYFCGHPYSIESMLNSNLTHMEYHMHRCLTHPEKMNLDYVEYSILLRQ